MSETVDKNIYNPTFQWVFLHPKYWPTWLGIGFAIILAYIPFRLRDKLAAKIVKLILKRPSGAINRAKLNISLCFPEKSEQEQQKLLEKTYVTAAQVMLGFSELLVRSRRYNEGRGVFVGGDNLFPLLEQKENVIALVPHAWAVDFPAILLASRGHRVTNMMKPQKNPITDWLMHVQRMQYGGKIYPRSAGIKPLIKAIKAGYLGYYLPDEDHGVKNSVFVPFFETEKATLKGVGKLARISKAKVVPMLPSYNAEIGKFEIIILPVIENFPSGDDEIDARAMNHAIEQLIADRPEQYMWVLNLLRTRSDGSRRY